MQGLGRKGRLMQALDLHIPAARAHAASAGRGGSLRVRRIEVEVYLGREDAAEGRHEVVQEGHVGVRGQVVDGERDAARVGGVVADERHEDWGAVGLAVVLLEWHCLVGQAHSLAVERA